jgi:hypothetical protein
MTEPAPRTPQDLLQHVKDAGFPYWQETIHLYVGGSELYGTKVGDLHDFDIYGVFVEPPDRALGIHPFEHFNHSTSHDGQKNTSSDVDICLWGLRHWACLACKGNPTVISALFAPEYSSPAISLRYVVSCCGEISSVVSSAEPL